MTSHQLAILVSLLLAGGATAASCLVPELTVMGIWGIPVLGFALLVGVIFRIAVYYDPREVQSDEARKAAYYVAGCLLCYLLFWSSLDRIFQKKQHFSVVIASAIGALTIMAFLTLSSYHLIVHTTTQTGRLKIIGFLFFNASSVSLVATMADIEFLRNGVKPIVIFFAYANWVLLAAVYSGIYREPNVFASNDTLSERLATWMRSKTQPGELLSSLQTLFTMIFFVMLMTQIVTAVPSSYSPIFKGIFPGVVANSFYVATHFDPRKLHHYTLYHVLIGAFVFFGVEMYFEWYMLSINEKTGDSELNMHSAALMVVVCVRAVFFIICVFEHMMVDLNTFDRRKIFLNVFHIFMHFLSALLFVTFTAFRLSSALKIVTITLNTIWYHYVFVSISAMLAGKYGEAVRQEPPPIVQISLEIRVTNGDGDGDGDGVTITV